MSSPLNLPGWRHVYSGKVRDLYVPADPSTGSRAGDAATRTSTAGRMLVVASDRVSAFDHVLSPGAWDRRLRDARKAMIPQHREGTGHSHDKPLPMVEEHLAALAAAGFEDVAMPWRSFYTVLFMARKA